MQAQLRFGNPTKEQIHTYLDEEPNLTKELQDYELKVGDKDRIPPWIPTISGRRFWIMDPRASDLFPADIVYCLSRLPRYNSCSLGEPYSIGQHCLIGSNLIAPEYRLHFLLHDATEFICQDIITPLKRQLGEVYAKIEANLEKVIAEKFDLNWTEEAYKQVKIVDNWMLATEVEQLTPFKILSRDYPCLPLSIKIEPMNWKSVYYRLAEQINYHYGENMVCSLEDLLSGKI